MKNAKLCIYLSVNSARNVTDRTKNMNARIITALLALLGFGAACSGVKETAKSTDSRADSVRVQRPIRLMYGVRCANSRHGRWPIRLAAKGGFRPPRRSRKMFRRSDGALSAAIRKPRLPCEPGFIVSRGLRPRSGLSEKKERDRSFVISSLIDVRLVRFQNFEEPVGGHHVQQFVGEVALQRPRGNHGVFDHSYHT